MTPAYVHQRADAAGVRRARCCSSNCPKRWPTARIAGIWVGAGIAARGREDALYARLQAEVRLKSGVTRVARTASAIVAGNR